MIARLWLLVGMLTVGTCAFSQFNDSTHYHVKYATAGIINKTNDAKSFVLINALGFQVNREKMTVNSNNAWIYGRQGSDQFCQQLFAEDLSPVPGGGRDRV